MEITIGVQNLAREVTLVSDQTAEEVAAAVSTAIAKSTPLQLVDSRGRTVIVPSAALGYVEIGDETRGPVGFGSL